MSPKYMTHSIREAAQALIDAIDAKLNDVIPYEQLADLRSALSAPQPTADERVAEHSKLIEKLVHEAWSWGEGCGVDGISSRTQKGDSHNEWGRDRTSESFRAVEQSARALLSASQEDAEHAAMYRWLRDNREGQMQDGTMRDVFDEDGTMLYGDELDAAIRAAMNETITKTRSQNLHAAGFTRRPSAKSLPSDGDEMPKMDERLYSDCKNAGERAEFFASGRAYETGIVSGRIAMDVARAFYAQSLVGEITYPANMRKEEE